MKGTIYTETVVWMPPEQFLAEAPYQLVLIDLEDGKRITARMAGDRVVIGDTVELVETKDGVQYFRRGVQTSL